MEAPGRKLLKVVGIIMIIFAALGILLSVTSMMAAVNMTEELSTALAEQGYDAGDLRVSSMLSIVSAAILLIAGIVGVINSNKPEKARICTIFGGVLILIELAEAIYSLVIGQFSVVTVIVGLILPVLYLWGSLKNLQTSPGE